MQIRNLSSAPKVPFDLDGKIMLSRKNLEVIHLSLQPGEVLTGHVNDFDEIQKLFVCPRRYAYLVTLRKTANPVQCFKFLYDVTRIQGI